MTDQDEFMTILLGLFGIGPLVLLGIMEFIRLFF